MNILFAWMLEKSSPCMTEAVNKCRKDGLLTNDVENINGDYLRAVGVQVMFNVFLHILNVWILTMIMNKITHVISKLFTL